MPNTRIFRSIPLILFHLFCAWSKKKRSLRRCLLRGAAFAAFALGARSAQAEAPAPASPADVQISASPARRSDAGAGDSGPDTDLLLLDAPAALMSLAKPAAPVPAAAPPVKLTQDGSVQIVKFKRLHWSPDENALRSDGPVTVVYTQTPPPGKPGDNSKATLELQNLIYEFDTGLVKASGGIRLTRPGNETFTGDTIEFNLSKDIGFVTGATISTQYFKIGGKRIEALANQTYIVTDGVFTTCERGRPDYHIAAKRLTVATGKYVSARNITLYLGSTRLISLPSYRRNLNKNAAIPAPRFGYSKSEGFTARYAANLLSDPRRSLDMDARTGLKFPVIGFLVYRQDLAKTPPGLLPPLNRAADLTDPLRGILEQLSPPTFEEYTEGRFPVELGPRVTVFAALQSRQRVFNRLRYDLLLSRFPEVGVNFANLLGHSPDEATTGEAADALAVNGTTADSVLKRIPNAPFLLDASVSYGNIYESPTGTNTARFATRLNVASQPLLLGKRLAARFAVTNFLNYYGSGTLYDLLAPEADINYLPTRTSLLGVGYRYATDSGRTPFAFDRRDVTQQLRLRYQVGGPLAFGIQAGYDLRNFANYETQVALVRNFDCMQAGFSYQFRAQSFNIIFNFTPPTASRNRLRREQIPAILPPTPSAQ